MRISTCGNELKNKNIKKIPFRSPLASNSMDSGDKSVNNHQITNPKKSKKIKNKKIN